MQPSLLGRLQSRRLGASQKGSLGSNAQANRPPVGDGLRGWACRIRTGESVRELSDWNSVTTSPELGASRVAETLPYELRDTDLQLRPIFQQTIFSAADTAAPEGVARTGQCVF
jgi:hypothetical protein